jgi:hypothetical protein
MRFKLDIQCDNAAFEEPATEIARVLREAATRIEGGELPEGSGGGKLRDSNGNTVGGWAVTGRHKNRDE